MTVKDIIFQFLTQVMGLNLAATCAVLANIEAECSYRPWLAEKARVTKLGLTSEEYSNAVDRGWYDNFCIDRVGWGICQWTHPARKTAFLDFSQANHTSITDLNTQLAFMRKEISRKLRIKLEQTPNTEAAAGDMAYTFCMEYEKPAGGEKSAAKRADLAKTIYRSYVKS